MSRSWVPLLTLVVGLATTAAATWFAVNYFEAKTQAEFTDAVSESAEDVRARIDSYVALLRGCSGLFAVQRQVTAGEFRAFVARLRVSADYPGVQGIGYACRVRPGEEEGVIARMREQGHADFKRWPEGTREEYFPILFLEPAEGRNRGAIGYDMFSEPTRRTAMEAARDSGRAAASAPVTLVQEVERSEPEGFLIYVPVYREGDVPTTIAERRAAIVGFAYSPFRANDLFREVLGASQSVFKLRVYDSPGYGDSRLLHEQGGGKDGRRFKSTRKIDVAGRTWTLRFESQPAFEARTHGGRIPLLTFLSGTLVTFLMFYFTSGEARARQAAEQTARRLKRSREAQRDSEERLRLVADSARDYAILMLDANGAILNANSGAGQLYGWTGDELAGRSFAVLFTEEERTARLPEKQIAQCLETGRVEDDRWLVTKAGERRYVTGTTRAIRDEFGHVHGLINVTRDITERREAEERLRKEKEFTDAIVQSVPGIFYVFDEGGRFIYWNRLFEEVTGFSAEEIRTTMDGAAFVPAEEREQFAARIEEVMRSGHSSLEGHVLRKDGQRVPYYFTGRRVELERGKCLVGMGIDITERRRAEDAAQRASQQLTAHATNLERLVAERTAHLEQSIASLEGVLYHVAHDLRAPLRAMHGFTSILLKEYGEHFDETGQEYARRISEAASRMDELIRDLLEYGRLCHAAMPLDKVELDGPVKRVLGSLREEIDAKHAEVEVDAGAAPVLANSVALEAIVSNLVTNSLKFVAPGATPKVRVCAEEYDGMVRLSVKDNGIGIDPKYQDKVFRVFERLHGTERYPGTGIGLAIVQKAAQRMHAKVGVQSTVGGGSTFWVELPKYA